MWTDASHPMNFGLPLIVSTWHVSFFKTMLPILEQIVSLKKRHIAHIQPWPASIKKFYIHPRVLLHSNVSPYYCLVSTKWSAPLWRRLCTYLQRHFLYHSRSKWLFKGFHSVAALSSFQNFLYLFNKASHSRTAVTLFENNSIFLSKACCTPVCKGTVQNDVTLCKECCGFMQGMSYSLKDTAAQGLHCRVCFDSKLQSPCWNLCTYYILLLSVL